MYTNIDLLKCTTATSSALAANFYQVSAGLNLDNYLAGLTTLEEGACDSQESTDPTARQNNQRIRQPVWLPTKKPDSGRSVRFWAVIVRVSNVVLGFLLWPTRPALCRFDRLLQIGPRPCRSPEEFFLLIYSGCRLSFSVNQPILI